MDRQARNNFIMYISIITSENQSVSSKIDVNMQTEQALNVLWKKKQCCFSFLSRAACDSVISSPDRQTGRCLSAGIGDDYL